MKGKEDFDVVIIGSGVSGLVCGCYLQKAGLKVAILEAREEAGGGRMASEMMRPGYLVQSCIWGDFEPLMMHQLNLDLDKYGYQEQEMLSDWGWGYLFRDGTSLVNNCWDPSKTAEKVGRFSEKDARKILEIAGYFREPYDGKVPRFVKFMELFFTEPWTWENFDIFLNLAAPLFGFEDPYELTDLNSFEMLDVIYESDRLKLYCLSSAVGGAIYPNHAGGAGVMNILLPVGVFYSHPKHSNHELAHVYIRCFRALGGKLFNSCPVKKILVAGGEAKGVILDDHAAFPGKEITAKRVVTNLNPRTTFTQLVEEEHVGKRVIQKLKTNWKAEAVLVTISYALRERPRFSAEKSDPDIVHSLTGMMGPDKFIDLIRAWGERVAGRIADDPMMTYALPHIDDVTQTRGGNCVANSYLEVPYALYERGGAQVWDDVDFRREIVEKCLNIWEEYSPGFRKNVLDYWMTTPLDMERFNPNYFRGDDSGGSIGGHLMFYGNRAAIEGFDKGGIVTPIKNLYGSGAVGPAWSSGGNGYRAACHIAEELGIRNQPWWTHRVFEYITKKYIEKTYAPLKPTSILDR